MIEVAKAMTPEEKAIVGNIKSLISQLEGTAGPVIEEEVIEQAAPPVPIVKDGVPAEDENDVSKDESGRAPAEEKLDELPVDDEEALAVLKSLFGTGKVTKAARVPAPAPSVPAANNAVSTELLKVMKSLVNRINEQELTLHALINGKEVADELLKIEKAAPRVPVHPSSHDIMAALGQLIQKSADTDANKPSDPGSMRDVLSALYA